MRANRLRTLNKLHQRDGGFAIASVTLLGLFLVLLSAVIVMRTMASTNIVSDDRQWEQALFVAESSIDYGLAELAVNQTYDTGHDPLSIDTRPEVVAAAVALAHDPSHPAYASAVHETGEGVTVVLKAPGAEVMYGVGITPSLAAWDAGIGKVRVVVTELLVTNLAWTPQQAILTGGPIRIEAKKGDKDIDLTCFDGAPAGCVHGGGWIHSNGKIEFDVDKNASNVTGCFTAYGLEDTVTKANGDPRKIKENIGPYTNNDDTAYPNCPDNNVQDGIGQWELDGDIPYIPIPTIDPMTVHYLAQYEICPDGIRWGPNAATSPHYPGSAPAISAIGSPCTGSPVTGPYIDNWLLGIKNGVELGKSPTEKWNKRVEFTGISEDGIYFFWGKGAKVKKVKGEGDKYWTFIGSKGAARMAGTGVPISNNLSCLGKDDIEIWNPKDGRWEDAKKEMFPDFEIEVENDDIYPYGWTGDAANPGAGKGYLVVTAGDVKAKVKGKKGLPDPGEIFGIIAAHEQVRMESSDADEGKGALYGAVMVEDVCDTKDSLHHDKISEFKKGDIINSGQWSSTDFLIDDIIVYRLLKQAEF